MRRFSFVVSLLLLGSALVATEEEAEENDDDDAPSTPSSEQTRQDPNCGYWLGPSPIKMEEEHGFGLGLFTGKFIPKGTILSAEHFVPVFDYNDEDHTPVREYFWNGDATTIRRLALETYESLHFFQPGLASIAPCTDTNFNLEQIHRQSEQGVPRDAKHPTAGSFSYHKDAMFTAIRDIVAGEELIVECPDDDFDGSVYAKSLHAYDTSDVSSVCLDDKIEERESSDERVGNGLFAKTIISKGTVVLASPVVPLLRSELELKDEAHEQVNDHQLLLNYCYGHPDSDLLFLPYGPLVNAINHPLADTEPNIKIQWHHESPHYTQNSDLHRRQQFHHPELLDLSPEQVAVTHGKGLMFDFVAIRDIQPGEELYLDYGNDWWDAWILHQGEWEGIQFDPDYISSNDYNQQLEDKDEDEPIRTITEQHRRPYPNNLQTACYFEGDWVMDPEHEEARILFSSYSDQEEHDCLIPCIILERYEPEDEDKSSEESVLYSAKLVDTNQENESINFSCHIYKQFEYILNDIPRHAITFVDKPHSSDKFLPQAFRHAIGVPMEGFYPDRWLKQQRIRRRPPTISQKEVDENLEFQRKKKIVADPKVTAKHEYVEPDL